MTPPTPAKPWYRILYVQVLIAVAVGILLGHFLPAQAQTLKPLGDGFIKLVKMIIAPVAETEAKAKTGERCCRRTAKW